jgi:DNA-binding transcriptional LysR family regulator
LREKLVERRPDGYVLTPAGTRTLAAASDMEAAAETLGKAGADDTPRGLVRVNASPGLFQGFLLSRLAKLPTQYPGIDIDVATDIRHISLDRREADIAIRFGRPQDGDLLARLLVTIGYGFYGTAAVRQALERGDAPTFVSFDEINADVPEAVWLARQFPRARVSFRANNQVAQAVAATTGAGIALLPHYIGRTTPGLQPCAITPTPPPREAWLLTRRQDRKDQPIRIVVDYLTRIFTEEGDLFDAPKKGRII